MANKPKKKKLMMAPAFNRQAVSSVFKAAASKEKIITFNLPKVSWPDNLQPVMTELANYSRGITIKKAIQAQTDVLIILYTNQETQALLDVFTNSKIWSEKTKKSWYPYGHNFSKYESEIQHQKTNALKNKIWGYLLPLTIGTKKVMLYKTELHPKSNGTKIPFIPVIKQLVSELSPSLVISTGTAGAIGLKLNCGDVVVTGKSRLHVRDHYPSFPELNSLSTNNKEIANKVTINKKYILHAQKNFLKLSLDGLHKCFEEFNGKEGYSFLKKNTKAPKIYAEGITKVPGNKAMDIVSADYITVDDKIDTEGLQELGSMNDTDDAFAFYAISKIKGKKPKCISVRNASEPEVVAQFDPNDSPAKKISKLGHVAGPIYGVYQYCTTICSAFACWGVVAGMN